MKKPPSGGFSALNWSQLNDTVEGLYIYISTANTTFSTILAEGVRFELTDNLRCRQFSRLVHSTALPTLQVAQFNVKVPFVGRKNGFFIERLISVLMVSQPKCY